MRIARIPATGGAMSTIEAQDSILGNPDTETSGVSQGISGTTKPSAPDGNGSGSSKERRQSRLSFLENIMSLPISRRDVAVPAMGAIAAMSASVSAMAEELADHRWRELEQEAASELVRDPILKAISRYKKAHAVWSRLCDELDDAECAARQQYGLRGQELVAWDHFSAISSGEIEAYRERLLAAGLRDPKRVEAEYAEVRARLQAKIKSIRDWDRRAGLAPLRKKLAKANRDENIAANSMARTVPVTPAGAAALISVAIGDIKIGYGPSWPWRAISTATKALKSMQISLRSTS